MINLELNNTNIWDEYAPAYSQITTYVQDKLFRTISHIVFGNILDAGSGPAKICPYLIDNKMVKNYLGIDNNENMISHGSNLLSKLGDPRFKLLHTDIEHISYTFKFDTILSINSYYSWESPIMVLKKFREVLKPKGTFILVAPNPSINMEKLLHESSKGLINHPSFESYREINFSLVNSFNTSFLSMDEQIRQLKSAGFKIKDHNLDHFEQGVNFIQSEPNV